MVDMVQLIVLTSFMFLAEAMAFYAGVVLAVREYRRPMNAMTEDSWKAKKY
jgi:hypothetical protein